MHTAVRRLLSAARTCKRAVWSCAKSVRKTILRCSCLKRNKKNGDEAMTVTSAEERVIDLREAIEDQTNPSATLMTVMMVHRDVFPTSTDRTSDVVCEEKPEEKKRAKRTRQNKEKSVADTQSPVELIAEEKPEKAEDGISRATKTPAEMVSLTPSTIESSPATKKEAETCNDQNRKKAKRTRRNKRKSEEDKLLPVEIMAEEKPEKSEDGISCDMETPAESVSLTSPNLTSNSAKKSEAETCKGQEEKKAKSVRRKRCKSKVDSLLPSDKISQKTEDVLNADEGRRVNKTAVDSSTLAPSSATKNEKEASKSRKIVVDATQLKNAVEVPPNCERIDEKPRKQPRVISDDVSPAKEQRAVACEQTTETSISSRFQRSITDRNCKGEPTDTSDVSGDKAITKSSGVLQCSTLGPAIAQCNTADGENKSTVKQKAVNFKLESNKQIELKKAEEACVPKTAVRKADVVASYAGVAKKCSQYMNEELNKKATSILNRISPVNAVKLTEKFKDLPINTVECLESITTLVFEKAIGKQYLAPVYAALCSAMQAVQVTCPESKRTVTFKALILQKCQDVFEADKFYRTEAAANELAHIDSCMNPEEKVERQLEYEKKERRMNKRSMGNCRFIGELFKESLVSTNIILYCITNLVDQRSEQPLESLCNLLTIVGEELERCTSLKGTVKKLNALTSDKSVSTRIRSMIRDVIDLRRNKWSRDVKTRKI